ncbi:MAG: aldo/keto reductase [Candidatus Omnitrophota bacterium]
MKTTCFADLSLSRLMLGTVQFGLPYGIANRLGQPSYKTVRDIICCAYQGGVNCLDTATTYGTSEEVIGKVLWESGLQDKVVVVTKIMREIPDKNISSRDADNLAGNAVRLSLKRLRLKRLPVCLFHSEQNFRYIESLLKLREKGVIGHVGVSVETPSAAAKIISSGLAEAIQMPTNVFDSRFTKRGLFQKAKHRKIAVFVRSVYLKGLLFLKDIEIPPALKRVIPVRKKILSLADEAGITPAELAVRYILGIQGTTSVVIGMESLEQTRQNLSLFARGPLEPDLMKRISDAVPDLPDTILMPCKWPPSERRC